MPAPPFFDALGLEPQDLTEQCYGGLGDTEYFYHWRCEPLLPVSSDTYCGMLEFG